jgi:outer membrane protein insertion porin family
VYFGALTEADTTVPLFGGIFGDFTEFRDSGDPRMSIGVGITWASPFGPIEVDFSKVVMKENFDEDETFSFNVGTRF